MQPQISTIPIASLASGDILSVQVYRFVGATPGKKAYLQSNLHGAEISGTTVIYELIKFLTEIDSEQLYGEIWLVPACNPLSTNQRSHHFSTGRYDPYEGKDWNRIFWDYEKTGEDIARFAKLNQHDDLDTICRRYRQQIKLSFDRLKEQIDSPASVPFDKHYRYALQSLCWDADYLLDLHSSTNRAVDYLYCFRDRQDSARYFLLDWAVLVYDYDGDAFDEAFIKPWLALEKELHFLGKDIRFDIESWTLELGSGMTIDPHSVDSGIRGIKNYFAAKGMLKLPGFPLAETDSHKMKFVDRQGILKYHAPRGGTIEFCVKLGDKVSENQLLYRLLVLNKQGKLPDRLDIRAARSGMVIDMAINHSANQGEYVLSVLHP